MPQGHSLNNDSDKVDVDAARLEKLCPATLAGRGNWLLAFTVGGEVFVDKRAVIAIAGVGGLEDRQVAAPAGKRNLEEKKSLYIKL